MRILQDFKRLAKDNHGGAAILFGLSLIPLIGAAGVLIDHARLVRERTLLHKALDGAVLAGVQAKGAEREKVAAAAKIFSGSYSGKANAAFALNNGILTGRASTQVALTLSSVLGVSTGAVSATSAATLGGGGKACIYLLEPTQQGLYVNSDSRIIARECSLHVNSAHNEAAFLNSRSLVETNRPAWSGKPASTAAAGSFPLRRLAASPSRIRWPTCRSQRRRAVPATSPMWW